MKTTWAETKDHNRMTGYAPVNTVYQYADLVRTPGSMIRCITRCRYAILVEMAKNGGDISFANVGSKRATRMEKLEKFGLVRKVKGLRRYELTGDAWIMLNDCEMAWKLDSGW